MERKIEQSSELGKGKTIAIISYITLIGLIISFVMNSSEKSEFAKFHIRQSIGITVLALVLGLLSFIPVAGAIISKVVGVLVLVAIILGIYAAISGEKKPLPIVGDKFQELFKSI